MNKPFISIAAALILTAVGSTAFAGEVPASFDAKNCKAEYPKASLMNEEAGAVSMSFLVAADGSVVDSKVEKSSGFKDLDKAAVKGTERLQIQAGHQGRRACADLGQSRLRLEAVIIH